MLTAMGEIYLNNTNLMYALTSETISAGTLREVFFCSQLHVQDDLEFPAGKTLPLWIFGFVY
jgi:hypothetical protein